MSRPPRIGVRNLRVAMSVTKFWVGPNASVVHPIGIIAASGSPDSDIAGLTQFCAPADAAG